MVSRALKNREYRRLLLIGFGCSAVAHAVLLGITFQIVELQDDESAPRAEEMSRPPFVPRRIEVIRLSNPSATSSDSQRRARGALRAPAPSFETAARTSSRWAKAAPAAALEDPKPWDAPPTAGLAAALVDQVALLDAASVTPLVFGDLHLTSPEPPADGDGESGSDGDSGRWLGGIGGIFGDIGISRDGGICPVPRGRAGWR